MNDSVIVCHGSCIEVCCQQFNRDTSCSADWQPGSQRLRSQSSTCVWPAVAMYGLPGWWWTTEWRAWGTPSTPCWWSCTSWPWWAWSAAASATAAASRGTCTWRSGHGLCWDNLGTWDWNYFIVLWCTSTVICIVAGLKIINHWNLGLEVCGYYRTHGQI